MSLDKIPHINKVIQKYFEQNKSESIMPAKDLMPYFVRAGIFLKDEKNGLPIRRILRQLDKANQLSGIPYVIAERKKKNTNWFFGRTARGVKPVVLKEAPSIVNAKKLKGSTGRKNSDEHYVIDLCDQLLGIQGSRQHRFPFLMGDSDRKLPVDVYYESLNLVIEFNEQQHSKAVKHFDKPDKLTVSGVHRGEQRKLYDRRKRSILPKHGIKVIDIPYSAFPCSSNGRILRDKSVDLKIVKKHILKYIS